MDINRAVNQDLLDKLAETFRSKNLNPGASEEFFSTWKLVDLKNFLKITNSFRGYSNVKKEIIVDVVTNIWNNLNKENIAPTTTTTTTTPSMVITSPMTTVQATSAHRQVTSRQQPAKIVNGFRYPKITPGMNKDSFNAWTIVQLQEFLGERGINRSGNKRKLVDNAYEVYFMNLPVTETDIQEEQAQIKEDIINKLILENGLVTLPNPVGIKENWACAPANLPDTMFDNVETYLRVRNAGKAFKGGKSLLKSGHLTNVMTHNISENIRYCFCRGMCFPEQKLSKEAYNVWICLHKDSGEIITADCSCTAGASGVCKHVGALLWYVEQEVRLGNNKTCTSKKQQWSVPSKKKLKIHGPDLIDNIEIQKPKADRVLVRNKSTPTQSTTNDPRPPHLRDVQPLNQNDIDQLATALNGNCGIVQLIRENECNFDNITYEVIEQVVEITTSKHVETPLPIVEIYALNPEDFSTSFRELLKIDIEQQKLIQKLTQNQSKNDFWYKIRRDRITASQFKNAVIKVDDNFKVINAKKTKSIVRSVCGYYPIYKSKSLRWGINNESIARNVYTKEMKKSHKHFKVTEPGFFINLDFPFVGASPDGLVECSCHGKGLLEIKCPWKYRNLSIQEYVTQPDSCLHLAAGQIQLKRHHQYYYQIQCQMHSANFIWCDFFICLTKDSFRERIYLNASFVDSAMRKAEVLFTELIVPEICSRKVKNDMDIEKDVKSVLDGILTSVDVLCCE